jgi:hypothetical protein
MFFEFRIARVQAKIVFPLGCPHQLPRIGLPAIVSARLGTGPRADSKTIPHFSTKARAWRGVIVTGQVAALRARIENGE